MMLAMHNFESAKRTFPSGGIGPYARIEDYLTDSKTAKANGTTPKGSPLGPDQQGMSWAFQILPYLEESATYDIRNSGQLHATLITAYHCPSKRQPTIHPDFGTELMDYAAAVPARPRSKLGIPSSGNYIYVNDDATWGTQGCAALEFWSVMGGAYRFEKPDLDLLPANVTARKDYAGHMGVIGRSNYCANCSPTKQIIGWYKRISFQQITDGSSKTMVLGEKRLSPALYESGDWHDDWSWAEGWDPDTLRSTICLFGPDTNDGSLTKGFGYNFGAAHPSAMTAGFADGSVTSIRYDIDRELFNRLGHRFDGEGGEEGAL